jgi:hypothetical protein
MTLAAGPIGCVYEGDPLTPPPEDPKPPPSSVRADTLMIAPQAMLSDTNHNGYRDTIYLVTYLFANRSGYEPPVAEEGRFVFQLFHTGEALERDAEPITTWIYEPDEVRRHRVEKYGMPAYEFALSLLEKGTDRLPTVGVDLIGRFEPADGSPVIVSQGISSVLLGKTGG